VLLRGKAEANENGAGCVMAQTCTEWWLRPTGSIYEPPQCSSSPFLAGQFS